MIFILLNLGPRLMAQKSDLFTYDHEKVNSAMDLITVENFQPAPSNSSTDTTGLRNNFNAPAFIFGMIPGCISPPLFACAGALVIGKVYLPLLIGGIVGYVVTGMAYSVLIDDPVALENAKAGALVGAGISIIVLLLSTGI